MVGSTRWRSLVQCLLASAALFSCCFMISLTTLQDSNVDGLSQLYLAVPRSGVAIQSDRQMSAVAHYSKTIAGARDGDEPLSVTAYDPRFFLVAAYEDRRKGNDSQILWLTAFGHRDFNGDLYCKFGDALSIVTGRWLHYTNKTLAVWRAALLSCPIPSSSTPFSQKRSFVIVGHKDGPDRDVVLPIRGDGGPRSERKQFLGVCVKSGYGAPDLARFVEWMELNHLLGVDHVHLYDAGMSGAVRDAFRHYVARGWLTLVRDHSRAELGRLEPSLARSFQQFDATYSTGSEPHPQTQLLSLQDCVQRFRNRFVYLLVIDIDEVLVPTGGASLVGLLKRLRTVYPASTGFAFLAAEYIEQFGVPPLDDSDVRGSPTANPIHMLKYTRRTLLSFEQVKTIHYAANTVAVNWHRKLIPPSSFTPVPQGYGWVHHYRARCKSRRCMQGFFADDGMTKLGRHAAALTANVRSTLTAVASSTPGDRL